MLPFISQPLYLFSNFFQDKAVEHLLGKGVKASDLNDDKLGRVMDKLYKYGINKLFLIIRLEVIKKYQISTKYSHLDSTSFHLHGQYNNRENKDTKEIEVNRENPIVITKGYSRDHRPDLKQCLLDLIVSSDGDIPIFMREGSGNESDNFTDRITNWRSTFKPNNSTRGLSTLFWSRSWSANLYQK